MLLGTIIYLAIGLAIYLWLPQGGKLSIITVLVGWPVIIGIILHWAINYRK